MPDAVMVPRSEMKFAIAQAIWEIDRNESAAARTLMVAAQNLLTAASTPVGGWEEPVAWRYPVLTARDEAVARMARAMRNGKAWPAVFQANTAEALAEDALAALEALAVIPTEGLGSSSPKSEDTHRACSSSHRQPET